MIRDFIELLNILLQNPEMSVAEILEGERFMIPDSTEETELFQEFDL